MTLHLSKLNSWPAAIIGFFVLAILFIATFIAWAVRQNVDLVREDYYAEELRFQRQLDRLERTAQLSVSATLVYDAAAQSLKISLPSAPSEATGFVQLYRPSNEKLDRSLKLSLNQNGQQQIDVSELQSGLWRIRVFWNVQGKEFFAEQSIVIPEAKS